jgi:metallo-beta-lactamase family protein
VIRGGAATVRIHGEEVRVKARIRSIDAYSGHADRDELVAWTRPMLMRLGTAVLVHGEPNSIDGLADALVRAGLPRERIAAPELDQGFCFEHREGRWRVVTNPAAVEGPRLGAEQASAGRDWHNDYAQVLLDMRAALRDAPDDRSRQRLLEQLRGLLARSNSST